MGESTKHNAPVIKPSDWLALPFLIGLLQAATGALPRFMASIRDELAVTSHRDRDLVEHEAARAGIQQELRATHREIAEYVEGYSISHPHELEHLMASGQIPGHPAWEHRIDWSNLLLYRKRLLTMLAHLTKAGTHA